MKTRKPRGPGVFSFVSKLAALDIGQSIIMRDHHMATGSATRLERDTYSQQHRAPALAGRIFRTERHKMIDGDRVVMVLEITREK